ncbi:MAG: aspartyl protease family protein, partial [Phenylobacterium sp.]
RLKFEFFRGNRIFLPVEVNGHPVEALLDSAAGIVTMDKAFAAQIGVAATGTTPMTGAGGASQGQVATGVTLAVGALRLTNVRVAIIDFSQVAAALGRPLPLVLGRDAFDASIVDIDFPAREIAFNDPATFHAPADAIRLPLTPTAQRVREIPVAVEGAAPTAATFDLGSSTALAVSLDYATSHGLLKDRPAGQALAGGGGGLSVHDMIVLKSLQLGPLTLKDVPALLSRSATELPSKGLNIGMPVLSRFRMFVDFGHDALMLVPNAAALAQPFQKDRAGLGAAFAGDHLNVVFVSPGGPADLAGWKAGDRIVAIDGEAIGPRFYAGPHANWPSGPNGASVQLTLADGTRRRLVLKDYF